MNTAHEKYRNVTALVVDDDEDVRESLVGISQKVVGSILQAENGEQAYELLKTNVVDVMITDIKMPQMNGIDLITKLAGDGMRIVTLMISAYGSREHLKLALQHGVYDFIDKPFDPDIVENRIRSAVELALSHRLEDEVLVALLEYFGENHRPVMIKMDTKSRVRVLRGLLKMLKMRHVRTESA